MDEKKFTIPVKYNNEVIGYSDGRDFLFIDGHPPKNVSLMSKSIVGSIDDNKVIEGEIVEFILH